MKMKQKLTFDCRVIDIQPGTGKHTGRMGALIIDLDGVTFKVGTGFTDIQRAELYRLDIIGQIIEVEGMELTELGRVRHPRFIRVREDLR
jgi:DNA ligase-1